MDLSNILISRHALEERFYEKWPDSNKYKNLEKTLRKLLAHAQEIRKKPAANVLAIIKYKRRARYFENSGWIFVTNEEATVLVTIERKKDCPEIWEKPSKKRRKGK
jgi:hypothetical protein